MNNRNRIRMAVGTVYAIAILISIFAGGLVWVAVIGALLVGLVNMQLGGYRRRS
jgi:hypothetical protein